MRELLVKEYQSVIDLGLDEMNNCPLSDTEAKSLLVSMVVAKKCIAEINRSYPSFEDTIEVLGKVTTEAREEAWNSSVNELLKVIAL